MVIGRRRVVVGISGGVDSAVAALCLLRAGYDVHGLHMTNWSEPDGHCPAAEDHRAAAEVCAALGIPLHHADFSAHYRQTVFASFLREYEDGRTPNPDVLCNREVKFGAFLEHARRLGAWRIATGHYAHISDEMPVRLLRARDQEKDQTYFLHEVPAEALASTLFPLGQLSKREVRRMALDAGLPNHDRPDSTGICFIGERPFPEFLARFLRPSPGPVLTTDGVEVGQHQGLHFHTLGQRSGLGIGGRRSSASAPWYVAGKDKARNALIVVQGRDHPLLWARDLSTAAARWIHGEPDIPRAPDAWTCSARIRHRHEPAPCRVHRLVGGGLGVQFGKPQWAPTPGQYVVFYQADECLGGAAIRAVGPFAG